MEHDSINFLLFNTYKSIFESKKIFLIYQIIVILVLILYLHKDRKSLWGEYIDVLEN